MSDPADQILRPVELLQPSAAAYREFQMRHTDWRRLCDDVERVRPPRVLYDRIATGSFSLAVASCLAGTAMASQRGPHAGASWLWLLVVYFAVGGAALLFGVAFTLVNRNQNKDFDSDLKRVKGTIKEIENLFPDLIVSAASVEATTLTIVTADYGTEGRTCSVIEDLTPLITGGRVKALVTDDLFGIPHRREDPHYEHRKTLFVTFEHQGRRVDKQALQNDYLELP